MLLFRRGRLFLSLFLFFGNLAIKFQFLELGLPLAFALGLFVGGRGCLSQFLLFGDLAVKFQLLSLGLPLTFGRFVGLVKQRYWGGRARSKSYRPKVACARGARSM